MRRALELASRLCILNGLYVVAIIAATRQLLDLPQRPAAYVAGGLLATGVFLVDRVKLSDRMLDPADAAAHPQRTAFYAAHAAPMRALTVALILAGAIIGAIGLHPLTLVVSLGAAVGVILYGSAPRGVRLKDRRSLKNTAVGGAVAVMALAFSALPALERSLVGVRAACWVGAFIFGHVMVDAALCDIDDAPTDAAYGVRTWANTLGADHVWGLSVLLNMLLLAWIAPVAFDAGRPVSAPAAMWALLPPITLVALALARPSPVRDWVDARMTIIGALCLAVSWVN